MGGGLSVPRAAVELPDLSLPGLTGVCYLLGRQALLLE